MISFEDHDNSNKEECMLSLTYFGSLSAAFDVSNLLFIW